MPNDPAFPPSVARIATDADIRALGRCLATLPVLAESLAEDRLEISIEPDPDGDVRTVTINGHGARWHAVLASAADRL